MIVLSAATLLVVAQFCATILILLVVLLFAVRRAKVKRTQEHRVHALLESLDQRGLSGTTLDPLTGRLVKIQSPITPRP